MSAVIGNNAIYRMVSFSMTLSNLRMSVRPSEMYSVNKYNLHCIKGALTLFVLISFSGYVC